MKYNKYLFTLSIILASMMTAQAQLSQGLIAHWPFNGNANDVSGNGFHGTPNNITYTTGHSSVANTAALFDGSSSYIDVAYQSALNVTEYSICARVKLNGYYTGRCETSTILQRGSYWSNGHYFLFCFDNPYDNGDCNNADTSKMVWASHMRNKTFGINPTSWQYSPNIVTQNWYCVVATYDDTSVKIYVDGVLKSDIKLTTGSIGTSSQGLSIGANNISDISRYPYWLDGAIGDLRLYDKALSIDEIQTYCNLVDTIAINDTADEDTSTAVGYINNTRVMLYPNPNNGSFTLTGTDLAGSEAQLQIINTIGQTVYEERVGLSNNKLKKVIRLDNLITGMYLLNVYTHAGVRHIKFRVE